ncbi:ComF family protein [Streptomyces canus]|uniref:ComF family protein n=1 Tax=Streptomyces canus TaxID=58343 RepID=UPI003710C13C
MPVLLVPVPSARRAVRARGHDPARRIALVAAGELRRSGMSARVVAVLRQRRRVADQSGLNSRQRLDNLAGALTVVPGGGRLLAEGLVVLVDDLMTTGASLTEAARAVREARARENLGRRGEQMRAGRRDQRQQEAGGRRGCRPVETGTWPGDRRPEAGARQGHRQPETAGQRVHGQRASAERHGEQRRDGSGRRGGRVVAGCDGEGTGVVYTAATRESMGERLGTVTEEDTDRERCSATAAGVDGVRDLICAAVVAASPDSFEINRN